MYTALLILLLLVTCGSIAWIGDWLGRRLGKKRLTVWGLRPRHTAILITVCTGVVIATFTMATAMAVMPGFQKVVIRGEKLVRDNRRLARQSENRQERLDALDKQLASTESRLRQTTAQLEPLQREQERLIDRNAELQRRTEALTRTNTGLTTRNRGLTTRNRGLQAEIAGLQQEQRQVAAEIRRLRDVASRYQADELLVQKGTPLTDPRPVPANAPREVLGRALDALLEIAREEIVRRHGAGSPPPADPPCRLEAPEGTAAGALNAAAIRRRVLEKADRLGDRNVVLRVWAAQNALAGECVPIQMDAYIDEEVYQAGEEVRAVLIDAGATEGVVFGDILDLLERVRQTALQPPRSVFPDENGRVGNVSYDRLLAVARDALEMGGTVRVRAIARQATRRSGPLNLDFAVEQISPPAAGG